MLFNLSFDVIVFRKTQGNIDIDDFKLETKQKYPIIYLNEHVQINYNRDLFRTDCVIEKESGKNDEHKKGKFYGTWQSMN
jgi:hypothetical protein